MRPWSGRQRQQGQNMRSSPTVDRAALQGPAALLAPLLLTLGGLALVRLAALKFNATDLFFDEAQYWSWSREPAFGYYSKPPLIAWIIGLATQICGDSTFCIRAPAPILHTATALAIYWIGHRFLAPAVGVWSALAFATLPGVSFSAGFISTDVPLLLCWALALWGLLELIETDRWWPAIVMGAAIGLGLNAKYAMMFFPVCLAIYIAATPAARGLLTDARLWTGFAIAGLLIAPNMAWNLSNSFATFAHTADNARWGGALVNFGKGLEFLGAQFGVFGPILLVGLAIVAVRAWRDGLPEPERLLLAFTLPVMLAITAQGFVSRAHANWAATAYVAGTLLVTSAFVRLALHGWLRASLGAHALVMACLVAGTVLAGQFRLPGIGDPYQRTLGWRGIAVETERTLQLARIAGTPFKAVFADERAITAELLYYMRSEPTPVLAWRDGPKPQDHYELTRAFRDPAQVPVLLVSMRRDITRIASRFSKVESLGERTVPAGLGEPRKVRFYALSGFRPG